MAAASAQKQKRQNKKMGRTPGQTMIILFRTKQPNMALRLKR
jgi:hypothetical protein